MGNLGFGVLIALLGGNEESVKAYQEALGKRILSARLHDNALFLGFTDGTGIKFYDNGQSCCEDRYMTTDDKPGDFIGSCWTGARVLSAENQPCEYGEHEIQFLVIDTEHGSFTLETHNEHNGYYGGFAVVCRKTN